MSSATMEKAALPPAVAQPLSRSWTEAEAFAYCSKLTRAHYENFPVGSFLIPGPLQPAVHSLYAFMRTADDFSDEDRQPGDDRERLGYLNAWEGMLEDCAKGTAAHPVFIALRRTFQQHRLPVPWLKDLLHAFKMDCTVRRYATYEDLLAYCRHSANPVGRLILTLFGYRDEELYRLSDAICTALQLANHWQDVAIDLEKDRIYLPQEDMKRFGVSEEWMLQQITPSPGLRPPRQTSGESPAGLATSPLSRERDVSGSVSSSPLHTLRYVSADAPTPQWREGRGVGGEGGAFSQLMVFEVARARGLFVTGRALPERVQGRLRWELRLTWSGGMRILDKIEAADYDVFRRRPVVTKLDWIRLALWSLLPPKVGEG